MRVIDAGFMRAAMRLADDAWHKGWHERNGGNLSYRIKHEELVAIEHELRPPVKWHGLKTGVPELAGEYLLLSGQGKYMRNISQAPEENLGIIRLDENGACWGLVWGLENGGRPSSELPSHLLNQATKKTHGQERVIYHAHPDNIIALSFVLPLDGRVFTRELWSMMPECVMVFPQGIALLPWMIPGSQDIAQASSLLMREYNVVLWAQHGLFCAGVNFDETFGLMETVEKAASILVKVLAMGGKEQGPSKNDIRRLAASLDLVLNEKMLI